MALTINELIALQKAQDQKGYEKLKKVYKKFKIGSYYAFRLNTQTSYVFFKFSGVDAIKPTFISLLTEEFVATNTPIYDPFIITVNDKCLIKEIPLQDFEEIKNSCILYQKKIKSNLLEFQNKVQSILNKNKP